MCGIFGIVTNGNDSLSDNKIKSIITKLLKLSESRGKEASGICTVIDDEIAVLKKNISASKLINTKKYAETLAAIKPNQSAFVMGHARMVTNGDSSDEGNNQPVLKHHMVCVHNGIIVNDGTIRAAHPEFTREHEVDTEVLLDLFNLYGANMNPANALCRALEEIEGSVCIAMVNATNNSLMLYTNIGSLYIVASTTGNTLLFASEKYILSELIKTERLSDLFTITKIEQLSTDACTFVDVTTTDITTCNLKDSQLSVALTPARRRIRKKYQESTTDKKIYYSPDRLNKIEKLLTFDREGIHNLRRCTKCLLPDTFPGIEFDDKGVCSICNQYKPIPKKDKDEFLSAVKQDPTKEYDCIVPLSGGRDSCYMLHYLVKEMGLKVVAYTYDWGMVTDLARRNIQRMCAALKVEHILISADITKKRENVRLNVNAWLKNPSLATIPLFMAGDKQFFYYAQLLKRQMSVNKIIFGMNSLEETKFKSGFAGIRKFGKDGIYYDFAALDKVKLALSYGSEFLKNPHYLNKSLLDSFGGYVSYYLIPKDFLQFFDYYEWDEKTVVDTIINEYNWETASDSKETWRIGDGTAPFYNYIYYKMAGFTEFDTFKSNQIREGTLDRTIGLASLEESNTVSPEGFAWYCDTIGIDPIEAIKTINNQATLY